jgi:hypothetical protein
MAGLVRKLTVIITNEYKNYQYKFTLKCLPALLNLPNPSGHTRPCDLLSSNRNEYQKH